MMQGDEADKTLQIMDVKRSLKELSEVIGVNVDPDRADVEGNRQKIFSLIEILKSFPELRAKISIQRGGEKVLEALGFHHEDPIIIPDGEYQQAGKSFSPSEEHRRLLAGLPIQVLPDDDDVYHLEAHSTQAKGQPRTRAVP